MATSTQKSAQDYINTIGGTDAYIKAQQAKQQAAQTSGDTAMLAKLQADSARTGLSYSPAPAAGTPASAQAWINNSSSGMGGVDAYTKLQNAKMTAATNNNDAAMLDKLRADSQRTGLTYSVNQPAPTQPTEVQRLQQTQQTQPQQSNSNADLINSIYQNNLAAQQQAAEKQRQIQQQGLNSEETSANQNALSNLNNNDAMASQQLKQLQEIMANNGVKGGDSITASLQNQTAQQNGANSINQNKANILQSINQQRSLIDNNIAGDNTAMIQRLQAARDGQLIDNNNTQQNYALQLSQLMGRTADGQNTLGGNQLALQQQGQNFNQNLQTNQFNQGVKNDTFNQGMANKQFDYQKVQDDIKNGQWTTQTENSMKQWAEGNKLNWAQFNQQTKQALAQIAISQQNANTNAYQAYNSNTNQQADNTLQRDKFNWDKNPLNPANAAKPASGAFNLDDYKGYITQNFFKDVPADPNKPWENKTIKQLDIPTTERYILSQPITNDQKAQLYKLYSIPMKN